MNKKLNRIRRATKTRRKLYKLSAIRLVIHRTSRHIYAQIISYNNSDILVSASTVEKNISKVLKNTSNKYASELIGKTIAERSLKKGIKNVSFDRSGFKYHGRIKVLADTARKIGLKF